MDADREVIFVNQRGTLHSDPHLSWREVDDFAAQSIGLVYSGRRDRGACRRRHHCLPRVPSAQGGSRCL